MSKITDIVFGPQNLNRIHFSLSRRGLLTQSYSDLFSLQQRLDTESIAPGLSVKIKAYQGELRRACNLFTTETVKGLINLDANALNFAALFNGFSSIKPTKTEEYIDSIKSLSSVLQKNIVDSKNMIEVLNSEWSIIKPLSNAFGLVIDEIEKSISTEAKEQSAKIMDLNKKISANIDSIFNAGLKTAKGIYEASDSVITSIVLKSKPDSNEKNYLITGINATATGVAEGEKAAAELRENYKALELAYQALAKENSILVIAKSINAQTKLFVDAYNYLIEDIAPLASAWDKVAVSYASAEDVISKLSTTAEFTELENQISLSEYEWDTFSKYVERLRGYYALNILKPQ